MGDLGDIELMHSIDDDQMCEYQGLRAIAEKILQAHRSGNLGLIKERERLMSQLDAVVIDTVTEAM